MHVEIIKPCYYSAGRWLFDMVTSGLIYGSLGSNLPLKFSFSFPWFSLCRF